MEITKKDPNVTEPFNDRVVFNYLGFRGDCNSDVYKWIATDKDGKVHVFTDEPIILGDRWICDGDSDYIGNITREEREGFKNDEGDIVVKITHKKVTNVIEWELTKREIYFIVNNLPLREATGILIP